MIITITAMLITLRIYNKVIKTRRTIVEINVLQWRQWLQPMKMKTN